MQHITMGLVLAVVVSLFTTTVFARTPDGRTPAEETVCDIFVGAAFGLCNAYCEATDCSDGVNKANARACQSLRKNWTKHTGLEVFPCDCVAGTDCPCFGPDLVVRIIEVESLGCPGGQGTCSYEIDIEVENVGSFDALGPFDVLVDPDLPGLADVVENFPGLAAGDTVMRDNILLGPGDNCFDPDCTIDVTVDPDNVIDECVESNNTAQFFEQG